MAKKYKFKLQGLMKLREFKEKRVKLELGEIVSEIQNLKDEITAIEKQIDEAYESFHATSKNGADGKFLQFYPFYIQGKREDIKNKENLIYSLERRMEVKRKELSEARGEVKVLENLREKEFTAWKKETMKKAQEDIDDLMTIRRNLEKGH
ncbi:MAG: flagellar export protein FliJ [Deltaproteobacteria bacterium]|jgi:flagellar protein FliJ|nr:MAG: flagellar export protein FliJ [Deltaproteobacteria bacterium]TNF31744.1 MAG: flagellar export protein FliJ [Deltaproteobacteria bacterium]